MEQPASSPAPAFSTVLISLVIVVNKQGQFAATHEHDGWYLPAGRVDFGETFTTGAKREALEEAGIPINLDALLRFEFTPGMRGSRMRAIYLASPADDTPLKSVPDEEVIEAQWLTVDELRTKQLRSDEVISLFEWAATNTRRHPATVLEGEDGPVIDNKSVVTKLTYSVVVLVHKDASHQPAEILVKKDAEHRGWCLPATTMRKPTRFDVAATSVIHEQTGIHLAVDGIIKMYHRPPHSKEGQGDMRVFYRAYLNPKSDDSKLRAGKTFRWCSIDKLLAKKKMLDPDTRKLLNLYKNTPESDICSPGMIAMEMQDLQILS